jgi:hypothetical protein
MSANEDELGGLHNKLASTLSELLEGRTLPPELDEEGNEIAPALTIPPSAAILTVAAKFLKDNNITCVPSKDNAIGELERKMAARKEVRDARRASATDLAVATEDMSFLSGLPN